MLQFQLRLAFTQDEVLLSLTMQAESERKLWIPSKQSGYSQGVKQLALKALEQGHSRRAVAIAAGVSKGTICEWNHDKGSAGAVARELALVQASSELQHLGAASTQVPLARIFFKSGAIMELREQDIHSRLVQILNEVL